MGKIPPVEHFPSRTFPFPGYAVYFPYDDVIFHCYICGKTVAEDGPVVCQTDEGTCKREYWRIRNGIDIRRRRIEEEGS